jgi:hypothetical protein
MQNRERGLFNSVNRFNPFNAIGMLPLRRTNSTQSTLPTRFTFMARCREDAETIIPRDVAVLVVVLLPCSLSHLLTFLPASVVPVRKDPRRTAPDRKVIFSQSVQKEPRMSDMSKSEPPNVKSSKIPANRHPLPEERLEIVRKKRHNMPFKTPNLMKNLLLRTFASILVIAALQSPAATVTSLADSGPGSLREAIAGGGVINFSVTGTINLTSGEIPINVPVSIQGPGPSQLTVQRSPGAPDFRIFNISILGNAVISGVTLSNGRVGAANEYDEGGCIELTGRLTLLNCSISGNNSVANYTRGTAIAVKRGGRLAAVNCLFSDNTSTGFASEGVCIYSYGLAALTNCTFSGNSAGYQAAIQNDGFADGLIIESCTIVSNRARFCGGVVNAGSLPTFGSTLRIHNSVLAGNLSRDYYLGPEWDLQNDGIFVSSGYNLIGEVWDLRSTIQPHITDRVDITGAELRLAPLADNGGPTLTHSLLLGSPAVDTGAPTGFPPTDQRGVARPFGPVADVGAFEANVLLPLTVICPPPQVADATSLAGASVTLNASVTDAQGRPVTVVWSVNGIPRQTNVAVATSPGSPTTVTYSAVFPRGLSEVAVSASNGIDEVIGCSSFVQVRDASAPNTVFVNNLADSGFGTLRQALLICPTNGTVAFGVTGVINLTQSELVISHSLKLVGPGADLLTIQRSEEPGTRDFRVIKVEQNAAPVTISGVTVRNGYLPGTGQDDGAGIENWTDLTLENVVVRDNRLGGSAARGAGLQNWWIYGTVRATGCTFANNACIDNGAEGGGIYNYNHLYLTNCTLSGNSSSGGGGALHNDAVAGTVVLHSCTIVNNQGEQGSAIFNNGFSDEAVELLIINSIVAGNVTGADQYDVYDRGGHTTSGGYNLFGTVGSYPVTPGPGDQFGVSAAQLQLGPLQDNGGTTPTHALLVGSIAIDAGSDTDCLPTDQRGVARPHYAHCDVGAFEADQLMPLLQCPQPLFIDCAASRVATLTATVHDPDGDPVAVIWTINGTPVQTNSVTSGSGTVSLTATFADGTSTVTVWASDGVLDPTFCSTTVNVGDRQAPTIQKLTATPSILRPANHQMVRVMVLVSAVDNCREVSSRIIRVTSSDPVSGTGPGDRSPDWEITGALTLNLRAEISGRLYSRVYTITVESRDASGNAATRSVTVTVPGLRR